MVGTAVLRVLFWWYFLVGVERVIWKETGVGPHVGRNTSSLGRLGTMSRKPITQSTQGNSSIRL